MFDFSVKFNAIDNVSNKINSINSKMASMAVRAGAASRKIKSKLGDINFRATLKIATQKAMRNLDKVQNKMKNMRKNGRDLGGKGVRGLASAAVAGAAALVPINVARKYELAFKDVKKAVDGTPEQLAKLRDKMKSFRGASFEELSVITTEAGKMGFNADNVMKFSDSVVKGAKALDFDGKLAVGQVGKILSMTNQMGTAVESGKDIMDKVVHLENKIENVKADGVIDVWSRNADIYSQLDFDNQSMGAMSAFLDQTSVSSELGARGFKIMINKFKALNAETGYFSHIKSNGIEGVKDVMADISKLTPSEQIKIFGQEALTLISKLQNSDNIAKLDVAMQISKNSAGAVEREWELFRATFDQRWQDSKKRFSNMMDTVGVPMMILAERLLDKIDPIIESISNWVTHNKKLATTIIKWGGIIVGVVAGLSILAITVGAVKLAMGGLGLLIPIITGKFGLLSIASSLLSATLWSNPITWIVIAVVGLIAAIVALIYYWDEFIESVGKLWDRFTGFLSSLNLVENYIYGVKKAFSVLTYPIRKVMGMLDKFLSKFNIYNKAKEKLKKLSGFISDKWDQAKDSHIFNGNKNHSESANSNVDNTTKNHTVVDVNVTAVGGAKADSSARGNGGVKLRNVSNGIAGA